MGTYRENEWKLIRLAKKQFGSLNPAEEKLFRSVVNPDKVADYSNYESLRSLLVAGIEPEKLAECENASVAEKILRPHVTGKELIEAGAKCCRANYPADADRWPDSRKLDADRIRWLCTHEDASALVSYKGIQICGARIEGRLDLEHAAITFPLSPSPGFDGFEVHVHPARELVSEPVRMDLLSGIDLGHFCISPRKGTLSGFCAD